MAKELLAEEKLDLIKSFAEEIVSEDELKELFKSKKKIIAYDGFEPSGQIHIAQGLLRAITVNKIVSTGISFRFWVADWFALLNNKLGGDLEKIKVVGEYFIEVWKACGLKEAIENDKVEFIWASDFIKKHPEYWETVLKLSKEATIQRVMRCGQIMGREESTSNPSAQILYPLMQAADIHHLNADIAQLGMDQRKVNMLARDIFPKIGLKSPVAIHHHMLLGLSGPPKEGKILRLIKGQESVQDNILYKLKSITDIIENNERIQEFVISMKKEDTKDSAEDYIVKTGKNNIPGIVDTSLGVRISYYSQNNPYYEFQIFSDMAGIDRKIAMKMSKSRPETAIFMTDTSEDVERKFKNAYCPEGQVEDNPVLEYAKYIVFERIDKMLIERPEKFGGNLTFNSYEELEKAFKEKKLHPMDLKSAVAKYIDELLEPVRKHFETDKKAKELLAKIRSFEITR